MPTLRSRASRLVALSIGLTGLLASAPPAAQPTLQTHACKGGKVTGDLLFGYAEGYAGGRGYRFGQGVQFEFPKRMEYAATQVNAKGDCEPSLATAKTSIRRVVDQMITMADEIPGYAIRSPGVIGEQTFYESMKKLCPLWPIC